MARPVRRGKFAFYGLAAFRTEIDAYLARHKMRPTTFGILAASGDRSFVARLRAGRAPSLVIAERVLAWIDRHPVPPPPKKRGPKPGRRWRALRLED
jgi:hypothetical protein